MKPAVNQIELLWSEFADQLGGFFRSRVNSSTAAEDLRQEVFLKLQKRVETNHDIRDLGAWLYRSARNALIDYYRTRKQSESLDENVPDQGESSRLEDPDFVQLMASFKQMIHALPDGYREAVLLADIEELPHKVVAERLGISLSATKSRVRRGREMLRKRLDACCQFKRDRRGSVIDFAPKYPPVCTAS